MCVQVYLQASPGDDVTVTQLTGEREQYTPPDLKHTGEFQVSGVVREEL